MHMNGPNGVGAASPRMSAKNVADASLSRAGTIVWFSSIAISTSVVIARPAPAHQDFFTIWASEPCDAACIVQGRDVCDQKRRPRVDHREPVVLPGAPTRGVEGGVNRWSPTSSADWSP